MENVRNRIKFEFIFKNDTDKIVKQQSKLTFDDIHTSYENYDSYTFKQNEVLMDKPIYLGFAILMSKILLYEKYYYKLQPYFGQKNLQLHYMDTDSFVLGVNTEDIIKDLKNLEDKFDFGNLDKDQELLIGAQVNIGAQLITLVILMKHKNKAILYHSYFTISVTMIVICFLRS